MVDVDQSTVPQGIETDVRTLRTSDETDKVFAALAQAQGDCEDALRDSANPFYHSTYADMASVLRATRQPKRANGLAILTLPGPRNGQSIGFVSRLTHSSGQWLEVSFDVELPPKVNPQEIGKAITYARRYMESAWMDLGTEDDDGNSTSHPDRAQQQRPKTNSKPKRQKPTQTSKVADDLPSAEAMRLEGLCKTDPAIKELVMFIEKQAQAEPSKAGDAARQIDGALDAVAKMENEPRTVLNLFGNRAKVRLLVNYMHSTEMKPDGLAKMRARANAFDDGSKAALLAAVQEVEKRVPENTRVA